MKHDLAENYFNVVMQLNYVDSNTLKKSKQLLAKPIEQFWYLIVPQEKER